MTWLQIVSFITLSSSQHPPILTTQKLESQIQFENCYHDMERHWFSEWGMTCRNMQEQNSQGPRSFSQNIGYNTCQFSGMMWPWSCQWATPDIFKVGGSSDFFYSCMEHHSMHSCPALHSHATYSVFIRLPIYTDSSNCDHRTIYYIVRTCMFCNAMSKPSNSFFKIN